MQAINKAGMCRILAGAGLLLANGPDLVALGGTPPGSLIGVTWNSTTEENEIRTVDPNTGTSSVVNTLTFDTGYWWPYTFGLYAPVGRCYATSSSNTLYVLDTTTGELLWTVPFDIEMQEWMPAGNGLLIGIGWNSTTQENELRTADPATGIWSFLNSFTFDTGYWFALSFSVDPSVGQCYATSSSNTLYVLDTTTGELLWTVPFSRPMQAWRPADNGLLIGIGRNDTTEENEICIADSATGVWSVLNSFAFDSGVWWVETFRVDPSVGRCYATSNSNTLHVFDISTGELLWTAPLDASFQIWDVFPDLASFCYVEGGCEEHISHVVVGDIDCSSGCDGYGNHTDLSTEMDTGADYAITVTNGMPVYPEAQCGIWVDWNQDLDFDDAGETVAVTGSPGVGPYTATITPPGGAAPGDTRMRIRIRREGALEPCGTTWYGEVEDYTITVVPGAIPGDLDSSGCVDLSDLAQLLSNYGTVDGMAYEDGDLDGDEDVDLADLAALLAHYGEGCDSLGGKRTGGGQTLLRRANP